MSIVTLMTDFGTRDWYVAAVKGVILGIAPQARIMDVTHEIEPHDVFQGAFVLKQTVPWYPPGTIHLAVVDPGVGSGRSIIVCQFSGGYVVAPDNGLVTLLQQERAAEAVYVVENSRYFQPTPCSTFHGRDVMAPVAAHLANGVQPGEFGRLTDRLEMLQAACAVGRVDAGVQGQVQYVDRFGTLVTNIHRQQLVEAGIGSKSPDVMIAGESIGRIRATFSDVPIGAAVALIGSCDLLEIAVNQGSAEDRFGRAATVHVMWR